MRLLKEFALFAAEELSVKCFVFLLCFSVWATSSLIHAYDTAHYMKELLFALTSTCVVLNVIMIVGAVKLVYDDFQTFRAQRDTAE